MRLLSLHIENFGKLSGFDYTFTDGVNEFCHDNGWGKSTLAAFIKVMLYGFEKDTVTARNDISHERFFYRPWQGGMYGGYIRFEAKGRRYRAEMEFGNGMKDDRFTLYDDDTGLESSDYTRNLGCELFEVDKESFLRSVYISQNDVSTCVTDNINAKIGNLVDNTDDINNYEKVDKEFNDLLNQRSPKRAKGALKIMENEITELTVKTGNAAAIDDNAENIMAKHEADKSEYTLLKKEREELAVRQKTASEYKDKAVRKNRYDALIIEQKSREDIYKRAKSGFKDRIPEDRDIQDLLGKCDELRELNTRITTLDDNSRDFDDRHMRDREKLEEYELKFATGVPSEEEIGNLMGRWGEYMQIRSSIDLKKANATGLRTQLHKEHMQNRRDMRARGICMVMMALILLIAGLIPAIFSKMLWGIFIAVVGIVVFITGARTLSKAAHLEVQENKELDELERRIEADEEYMKTTSEDMEDYFIRYNMPFNESLVNESLFGLKAQIEAYYNLKALAEKDEKLYREKKENYDSLKSEEVRLGNSIRSGIEAMGMEPSEDMKKQLLELREMLRDYRIAEGEYSRAIKDRESFEKENGDYEELLALKDVSEDMSLSDIEKRIADITERLEGLNSNLLSYERELEDLRLKRESCNEAQQRLDMLKEEYDRGIVEYKDIELARELLREAKVNLTNKYTGPISRGFERYYSTVAGQGGEAYSFDANIKLIPTRLGNARDITQESAGYRDLTGVCMRLALVDVMYKEEKPFLIFDDPYVNLDDSNLAGGKQLLKDIGRNYQVLYFTCHGVRSYEQ